MADLPAVARSRLRARRWDAIVVGGALPGLVAAARLCMDGQRVLVIEEEAAARAFPPLREPFLLAGAGSGGVLAVLLRELSVPLIDARRLEPDPLAYQVVLPEARIDVGGIARTGEELVTWGLAKPDVVQPLLRALARSSAAERDALLASPVVRAAGLRRLGRGPAQPTRHARGMPVEAATPPPELAPFFEAQVRVLSNLDRADPGPEARARLLGSALDGGAAFPSAEHSLRGLLRERILALHGEFRTLPGAFELVAADGEPGLAPARSAELWLGRVLVLNAHRGLLARLLREADLAVPPLLDAPAPARRRAVVHLRTRREVIPSGMARRVVRLIDPLRPADGTNVLGIALHPLAAGSDAVHLIASAVVEADDPEPARREAEIEDAVRALMPFSEGRLARQPGFHPRWDDDAALEDPAPGAAWPAEVEIRAASRPPVYALARSALGGLGAEGDLLLGWRAGERIAADLG